MLPRLSPADAYRRVELDAWIAGGDPRQLTRICLAEALAALNRAMLWDERAHRDRRSGALMKAMSCLQALKLGVDPAQPLGDALLVVYGDAAYRLAQSMCSFSRPAVAGIRQDLIDLEQAFAGAP